MELLTQTRESRRTTQLGERFENVGDDELRSKSDPLIGELHHQVTGELQGVDPFGVAGHLILRAMPAISEQLNHQRHVDKAAVDAHGSISSPGQNLLGAWTRKAGIADQLEKAPFEPTVPTTAQFGTVDHVEKAGDAISPAASQGGNSAMHELF